MRHCRRCGKELTKRHQLAFCSRVCSNRTTNDGRVVQHEPNTTCTGCGTPIYKKPSHLKKYRLHYCQWSCRIATSPPTKPPKPHNCWCEYCGRGFRRKPSSLRNPRQRPRFCSRKCKDEHLTLAVGKANSNWRGSAKERKCSACGIIFRPKNCAKRFCSLQCAQIESPAWGRMNGKRGTTAEHRCITDLREAGFRTIRAAASKGPFDVIGLSDDLVRLIQVKRTKRHSKTLPKRDVKEVLSAPTPEIPQVSVELWLWRDNVGWLKGIKRGRRIETIIPDG